MEMAPGKFADTKRGKKKVKGTSNEHK